MPLPLTDDPTFVALVDKIDHNFGKVPAIAHDPEANEGPAINLAFENSDVTKIVLPSWEIGIGECVVIPSGKRLEGQNRGKTTLKALPGLEDSATNTAVVRSAAGSRDVRVSDLTIDVNKVGLGGTSQQRTNGVVMLSCLDYVCERLEFLNATAYGFWSNGGNDVTVAPSRGVLRDYIAKNCQIHVEHGASEDCLVDYGIHEDGDGDVPCFSWLHPLIGSRRISYAHISGRGTANAGVDPMADGAHDLGLLSFDHVDFELSGHGIAFSVAPGQPGSVERIRITNSRFVCAGGVGASFRKATVDAGFSVFGGKNAVYFSEAGGSFDSCEINAVTDPGGGVAAIGLAIGSLGDPTTPIRLGGSTRVSFSGPPSSAGTNNRGAVWVGPDAVCAANLGTAMVVEDVGNTSVTARAASYYEVQKSGGGTGFNGRIASSVALAGNFEIEVLVPALQLLRFGLATVQDPTEFTAHVKAGFTVLVTGNVLDRVSETPYSVYLPGERFWIRRYGSLVQLRQGGATFERGRLLRERTVSDPVYFSANFYNQGDKLFVRGLH